MGFGKRLVKAEIPDGQSVKDFKDEIRETTDLAFKNIHGKVPKQIWQAAARARIDQPLRHYWRCRQAIMFATDDEIIYGAKRIPLAGAKATVDTSGNTAIAQGWVVKERKDTRQLFLTIEGNGDGFALKLPPDEEQFVRGIATYVNSHAGQTTTQTQPDIPEQIRKLAELKDAGILSEAEFDAKKGELLARM